MDKLKLKAKIAGNGFTQQMVAKAMNISFVAFNAKLNGKRGFTVNEAVNLSIILRMTNEEILEIFFDK